MMLSDYVCDGRFGRNNVRYCITLWGDLMNVIWFVLIAVSIAGALISGHTEPLTKALFDGARAAVDISLFLLGIISLWLGVTKIIEESGLIHRISHFFKPIITSIFRSVPPDHPAITSITLNLLANFFGLGNAATPLGIKAMQDLQTLNRDKETITFAMMLFIVLNTASIQFIPFTVVGILSELGSAQPSAIVVPTLCATVVSAACAVLVLLLFRKIMR
ncbi:MAG: spore maturation protein [Desulfobacterota bacterium]|nr:spore maturation protein [Thermodesulfobacteriota bacterium]